MNPHCTFRYPTRPGARGGFSLVEIVLAIGIFAFVGVALIGLFSVGLKTNRESIDELEATALAQSLLNTRKAAATNALANFAIPPLDQAADTTASPLFLSADGSLTNSAANARFGFLYRIRPETNPASVSSVYLCLYWPAPAAPAAAQGRCEIISTVNLP